MLGLLFIAQSIRYRAAARCSKFRLRVRHGSFLFVRLRESSDGRSLATLTLLTALLALGAPATGTAPARGATPNLDPIPAPAHLGAGTRELPQLRTRTSRTYLRPDGTYVAQQFERAVNYAAGDGSWLPIDNTLVPVTGGWKNAANDFVVRLPTNIADPVRVSANGADVSFTPVGAAGSGVASGATVKYADAWGNVDVAHTAVADGLKETLTLKGPSAPNTFRYEFSATPGLTARLRAGGELDFVDAAGATKLSIPAPFMRDSSGTAAGFSRAVSFRLSAAPGGGYTLTLVADAAWLSDPARVWPVKIDPSFGGGIGDCTLKNGAYANTRFCQDTTDQVGFDGSTISRTILDFGLPALAQPQIVGAELRMYLSSETAGAASAVGAHRQTRASNNTYATWNTYDGTNPWTTPGGDFDPTPEYVNGSVGGGQLGWYSWWLTKLVSGWYDGSITRQGIVLKATNEAANHLLRFNSFDAGSLNNPPQLFIYYRARVGLERQYTYVSQQINDVTDLHVNVANGNLVVHQGALQLAGVGIDLGLDFYYNSLPRFDGPTVSQHSLGAWSVSPNDVHLDLWPDGAVTYVDESYYSAEFFPKSGGGYTTPDGTDAQLVKNADSTYTLTFNDSGTRYNFRSDGRLVSQLDANGNKNTLSLDGLGRATSITDSQGRVTTLTYNGSNLLTFTDPAGRWGGNSYDTSFTQFVMFHDADLHRDLNYGYDGSGRLNALDFNGGPAQTTITYDTSDRVKSIKREDGSPSGAVTSFTYNSGNTVVTDPNGHQTTYFYDSLSRVTKVTDAKGNSSAVDYTNARGGSGCADHNPCSATDALGNTTTFGYDANNNLLWSQSPLQGPTNRPAFAYANATHPYYATKYTDPQGSSWNYNYDEGTGNTNGNLTSKSEGAGQNPVRFTYNANGTLATATDAKGAVTTYSYVYDTANPKLLKQVTVNPPAPLTSTTIRYDTLGRVATETDGNGNTRTYTYGPGLVDRISQVSYSNGAGTNTISYGYDSGNAGGDGNLTSMNEDGAVTSYAYDALNRLTTETRPGGGSTSYTYDSGGNLTSVTDAGGTTSYLYDAADLLTKITEPGGNQISFGYDANGNRTAITYPGSVQGTIGYDAAQRITSVVWKQGLATIASFTYCYRAGTTAPNCSGGADTDLRKWVVSQIPGDTQSTTTTYGYDVLARLTSASSSGGSSASYQYAYDANGNRTSQTVNGVSTYYLYNAANQLCWSGAAAPGASTCANPPSGGKTYAYDGNGNMTIGTSNSFAYNRKNQTSSITPNGGAAINMAYSGVGQARRTQAGGTTYVNDVLGVASEGSTYYTRDTGGTVLGERNPGGGVGSYYFLFDGLGSVVAVCDVAGVVKDTFKYDPFGANAGSTGAVANPWRFTGGYYDAQTSLYKFGERYYDQSIGRWTQIDAVNDPLNTRGWNRYTYVGDDPANFTDPTGKQAVAHCHVDPFGPGLNRQDKTVIAFARMWCVGDVPALVDLQVCIQRDAGSRRGQSIVCGPVSPGIDWAWGWVGAYCTRGRHVYRIRIRATARIPGDVDRVDMPLRGGRRFRC